MKTLREIYLRTLFESLIEEADEEELSKDLENKLLKVCDYLKLDLLDESFLESKNKNLLKKFLLAIVLLAIMQDGVKPTDVFKDSSRVIVKYVVEPINNQILEPLKDKIEFIAKKTKSFFDNKFNNVKNKAEDSFNKVKDKTNDFKNGINDIFELPNEEVEISADFENKELTSLKASVIDNEILNIDISELNTDLVEALKEDMNEIVSENV